MESTPSQAAEGLEIVRVLASVLDRLVCTNAPLARADPGQVTKFHALKAPGIGILDYLERIHKYASCSNECFILALIYIDRLIQRNNFLLTELNVHRVVITAILLAAKFLDDAYYNNAYYSKVGGVLVSEMNGLEVDFLFRINFSLHVSPEVFEKYKAELVSHSANAGLTMQQQSPGLVIQQHLSASAGLTMPQQQDQSHAFEIQASQSNASMNAVSSAHVQSSVPSQMHIPTLPTLHPPPQVTPSPSHLAPCSDSVPLAVHHVPQNSEDVNNCHPMYVSDHLFSNGITQQFLQRANSLPASYPAHAGRCSQASHFSAPMVSMIPATVENDQFFMIDNHLFPLQTTLVHHHHGMNRYPEQNVFHQRQHTNGGYSIGGDVIGSLVAGHY